MSANARWAVVTGASSGIGRALALEFAAGGFSVLLTGRDQAALDQVAGECSRHGTEAEVVTADLSDPKGVDDLVAALASTPRQYEVLVNNAGFGIVSDFVSSPIEENIRLVEVQLNAALKLTHALVPAMLKRGSGRILNVASVYSFSPVPFQSVYAACKGFLMSFSRSLENELAGTGVTVTVFCPGVTQTQFRQRAGVTEKRSDAGMTAETAASIAYIGTLSGKAVVVPGLVNRLFVVATKFLPSSVILSLMRFNNRRRGLGQS